MNIADTFNYLETLGSADAIAEEFTAIGITGRRADACACPVANYTQRVTGRSVMVGSVMGGWTTDDTGPFEEVETPPAIVNFIENFDDGVYPELVSA